MEKGVEREENQQLQGMVLSNPLWYRAQAGEKHAAEPDDAELVSLSKRLVENAVLKAVQQYLEETQNKTRQTDGSPVKTEEGASGSKNESDNDNSK
ncbi:hypothetical protein Q9966_014498 [Columba livia]|nr:hypothetical protein Q9966_014498 [Columba livia]